jgi:hypothetical protein
MNNIEITVPYAKRHLIAEIKTNGAKFNSEKKTWVLEDNAQNRALKELVERRVTAPSQADRIQNIAALTVDLLNALKLRQFTLIECGDRIVVESVQLVATSTPPIAAGTPFVAESKPLAVEGSSLAIS